MIVLLEVEALLLHTVATVHCTVVCSSCNCQQNVRTVAHPRIICGNII